MLNIKINGEEEVIGTSGLIVNANPPLRHSDGMGIMIHKGNQNIGVGTALMEALLNGNN